MSTTLNYKTLPRLEELTADLMLFGVKGPFDAQFAGCFRRGLGSIWAENTNYLGDVLTLLISTIGCLRWGLSFGNRSLWS